MPQQPGTPVFAPKGAGVADAFARLGDTLARAANRGNPASARKRMADQRLQEAMSAFGATIGQTEMDKTTEARPRAAGPGKTIDPGRAPGSGRRVIALAFSASCGEAG